MGAFEDAVKKKEDEIRLRAKIPVPVSPEIEGAPNAGMTVLGPSSKPAQPPQASVRGVPGEMTAEYIPPAPKPSAVAPAATGPSPAMRAATRLLRADAELKRIEQEARDTRMSMMGAGLGLGTAVGTGLAGPVGAPLGAVLGQGAGLLAGALEDSNVRPAYYTAKKEYKDAQNDIAAGLRDQVFTQKELADALDSMRPVSK